VGNTLYYLRFTHSSFPLPSLTAQFRLFASAGPKRKTGIEKELTPKTLRHTHVIQAIKRGEGFEQIFDRIGLAPDSRQEAEEMYKRLAGRGI
jgi:hypothetical protein